MIRKSGYRFSEKIMLEQKDRARWRFNEEPSRSRPNTAGFADLSNTARAPKHRRGAASGPCQARPEPVAMARFRDISKMFSECMRHGGPCALKCSAKNAPVAQLDRAPDYESGGQEFESLRARQIPKNAIYSVCNQKVCSSFKDC